MVVWLIFDGSNSGGQSVSVSLGWLAVGLVASGLNALRLAKSATGQNSHNPISVGVRR